MSRNIPDQGAVTDGICRVGSHAGAFHAAGPVFADPGPPNDRIGVAFGAGAAGARSLVCRFLEELATFRNATRPDRQIPAATGVPPSKARGVRHGGRGLAAA